MARDMIVSSRVELQAVLSTARITSGVLARLVAGEPVEIAPADNAVLMVTFEVGGRRLAQANVRNEGGKLIATITKILSDRNEWKLDEWRLVSSDLA